NNSAQQLLLDRAGPAPLGLELTAIAPPIAELLASGLSSGIVQYNKDGELLTLAVKIAPAADGHVITFEDITRQLVDQRQAAWSDVARRIAHEIKNPLTPIRLSAEHMQEVWRHDREHFGQVFERCSSNILQQVDELQQIAREFSTYSQIPRLEAREGDLAAAMRELAETYRGASGRAAEVRFSAQPETITARFDARLLRRAVRNLLENSLRVTAPGGAVTLRVEAADGNARIAVADQGPGVDAEVLPRIFDPYFSTHDSGTGLGLPIARRIAEEHGGAIQALNRPGGGLEVVITIPRS
ncbi:MAG TPA: ATP-binding protein, partial [Thermoanaerobaculia bacterium]|nr:ATP-binding protein [Thermoanaerobaculia bacterium]